MLGTLALAPRAEAFVYWAGTDSATKGLIARANLDGTGVQEPFITGDYGDISGAGVAIDGKHIYWSAASSIGRANLDGSNVEPSFIRIGVSSTPCGVAVDGAHSTGRATTA